MNYFLKVSYDRSLIVSGLELDYDVNLDEVIEGGGQGDVSAQSAMRVSWKLH
jgi:hypothetical protein